MPLFVCCHLLYFPFLLLTWTRLDMVVHTCDPCTGEVVVERSVQSPSWLCEEFRTSLGAAWAPIFKNPTRRLGMVVAHTIGRQRHVRYRPAWFHMVSSGPTGAIERPCLKKSKNEWIKCFVSFLLSLYQI